MSFDAGGRVGVRSAKQIKNNLFAQRRITKKDGGTIPLGLLEDRYDITEFDEDTDRVDKYMRNSAMYNGPDSILWEHDLPRRNAATNAGLLNLRLNGSLGKVPDQNHSEMFIGFSANDRYFGKDPRGTNEDPDFRGMATHMYTRGKEYIKTMPRDLDEDKLIDTGNIYRPIKDRRDMFYPVKDRYRIFSTTLDGRNNPRMKEQSTNTNTLNLQDARINLQSNVLEDIYRAPDYTTINSNQYMYDYSMSVTDHRVPVAQYGEVRTNPHLTSLDLYSSRSNNQLTEHRIKDEIIKKNNTHHDVADPRLIAGIATRLASSDTRTKDSADTNGVIPITNTTKDIDRFVTEYTSSKTGKYKEFDTPGIYNTVSYEGNTLNEMLINTTSDYKRRRPTDDVRDTFITDNRKQLSINNTALSLLQVSDRRKGTDISNEIYAGTPKINRMVILSAVNGAVSSSQISQVSQGKKYAGIDEDSITTFSYKDMPSIGNVSKLKDKIDSGDIDMYDSTNTHEVRAGNRNQVYSKSRDNQMITYDYSNRTDNSGNDGSYGFNKKYNNRNKHIVSENLRTSNEIKTNIDKEMLTPNVRPKKNPIRNISNNVDKLSVRETSKKSLT